MGGPGGGMGGPGGGMGDPRGTLPDGATPTGTPDGTVSTDKGNVTDYSAIDDINRISASNGVTLSGTYETVQDYIDALNTEITWVNYDNQTGKATITSIEDFVTACKTATKSVGAFDDLNESQGENTLFGYGDGSGAHFDSIMAELLADNTSYGDAYAEDMTKTDASGNTVDYRVNMYNPMYYLDGYYE